MNHNTKRQILTPIDVIILAIILFHSPIWDSYQYFTALSNNGAAGGGLALPDNIEFTESDNYANIKMELVAILSAAAYLILRRFDFSRFPFHFSPKILWQTLGLILLSGTICHWFYDVVVLSYDTAQAVETTVGAEAMHANLADVKNEQSYDIASYFSSSLLLFSLLNGFYEEIFFLGILFCVPKKWLPCMIIFALMVRFSFHTYQGILSALNVTLFGVILTLCRFKINNLIPFMLAHSFFDIFGLGLPLWLLDYI